jgi:hypothetical protein
VARAATSAAMTDSRGFAEAQAHWRSSLLSDLTFKSVDCARSRVQEGQKKAVFFSGEAQ